MDLSTGVYVFFFFKQKTAYEMRISDWSSDVCSSDLLPIIGRETKNMANGGTDDIGMAHHHHGAFRHRSSHFIEMVSDSALHLDYSLSPRRTALTARFVPAPPIIAVFQDFKGPSRPSPDNNFIQTAADFRHPDPKLG